MLAGKSEYLIRFYRFHTVKCTSTNCIHDFSNIFKKNFN